MYREFAGNGDINLSYMGQNMNYASKHKDTWFELGVGGNYKVARNTHLYGDVLKTFGADISKKWQVNAGLRWEF